MPPVHLCSIQLVLCIFLSLDLCSIQLVLCISVSALGQWLSTTQLLNQTNQVSWWSELDPTLSMIWLPDLK